MYIMHDELIVTDLAHNHEIPIHEDNHPYACSFSYSSSVFCFFFDLWPSCPQSPNNFLQDPSLTC